MPFKTQEEKQAWQKKWNDEHRDQINAKKRERRAKATEEQKEHTREVWNAWRSNNIITRRAKEQVALEKWHKTHPDGAKLFPSRDPEYRRKYVLMKEYGLTFDEYNNLLEKQNNTCAVCGNPFPEKSKRLRTYIDHDHTTGKVRGILCAKCNTGLGHLEDTVEGLKKALAYLEKHNGKR